MLWAPALRLEKHIEDGTNTGVTFRYEHERYLSERMCLHVPTGINAASSRHAHVCRNRLVSCGALRLDHG